MAVYAARSMFFRFRYNFKCLELGVGPRFEALSSSYFWVLVFKIYLGKQQVCWGIGEKHFKNHSSNQQVCWT